ncbi:MAG: single-stranded DNA-binding protein [Flavobacteriales bacterium]|jgi:single-strand DNA-binding protein
MNYVNLIGKMSSEPKFLQLEDGQKVVNFTLSTQEPYLDKTGQPKIKKYWHKMTAWGNLAQIIEHQAAKGTNLAIEGRLTTRFYQDPKGVKKSISEVEINDLSII